MFKVLLLISMILLFSCASPQHNGVDFVDGQWRLHGRVLNAGTAAEGLLLNVRMVNAAFEDLNRPNFNPAENTAKFIDVIVNYKAMGVNAFTLNLQGGNPGYEGALNSAFAANGSLRPEYIKRIERIIRACAGQEMVVILGLFYQRQDQTLRDSVAVKNAVLSAVDWVSENKLDNVVIEIANEFPHRGFDHDLIHTPSGMASLIRLAKNRNPNLLVSASGGGNGRMPQQVADAADFLLIHFNGTQVEAIPSRIEALRTYGKPIVCNEDDKIGDKACAALRASLENNCSYGYMNNRVNQYQPFEFNGEQDDPVFYNCLLSISHKSTVKDSLTVIAHHSKREVPMKSLAFFLLCFAVVAFSQNYPFNGLNSNMNNLHLLSNAKTRSISPENLTGEKGKGGMAEIGEGNASNAARDLGQGWKVNPYIHIKPGETATLAEIDGPGAIQQIWMTPTGHYRYNILRFYWDDETEPSVEVPVGDFFANGWNEYHQISSLAVCVNPGSALNCYWTMPFRKKCRITMENIGEKRMSLYYQINYTLTDVPDDAGYFHAQFRRSNPTKIKEEHVILDGVKGKGQYVGTYMNWQSNNNGWWGEGEIKFFMDGDKNFPTICGTGTEDYFCGSYGFSSDIPTGKSGYVDYSTPYSGFYVVRPSEDLQWKSQTRFGLYRWHITDPIRFDKDLKVTIQALGWRSAGRYQPLQDDVSSVAFWYQTEPHGKFPPLPGKDELEIR